MHERQAINTTPGSSSMKPKSFSVTLRSSVEDVHVITLPAYILTGDQTNTYKLDAWSRFNGFPELDDINQLEPRLVESRLSIIDRQDRILKAQLEKINHDRKSMKADVKKYEDFIEYLGRCEYGDDMSVVSKADIIADGEFLLDEKAAQKLDLEELLEKVNALKSQVEYRVKKLSQGIAELKTGYDKHELKGEDEVCLRNLLMKIGPFGHTGTRCVGSKIPMLVSTSKTTGRKIGNEDINQMNSQTEYVSERKNVRARTEEKINYTPKRNEENNINPSQNINGRYKDIKSKLNTGRKCVEREVGKAWFEQRNVFKQDGGGKGKGSTNRKRRKVIKCKIDTGRNNAVRHKADKDMENRVTASVSVGNKQANASDMKTRNEGKNSFANKPLLPQIESVSYKNAIPQTLLGSEKINGINKLAPLPKVKGTAHDAKYLIYPHEVGNGALTTLPLNRERSTPLPPIKSTRSDNDNMKTGSKDNNRNADVMCVSFAPSPPPRAQLSPPHIIDNADRTQHRD